MTRKRRLKPDEAELWDKIAQSTVPLRQHLEVPKPVPPVETSTPKPEKKDLMQTFSIPDRPLGRNTTAPKHDLAPQPRERLHRVPLRMDQKTFAQIKRGKIHPEARLDLHGMTMERAHPALTGFVMSAFQSGKRLVLVITGKGKDRLEDAGPIPVRRGVLRHQVPQWLDMAPLSSLVLQVVPAHQKHGGAGAYYVYLRRNR